MYIVAEQVCELCDEVNDHLTADCPHVTCDRHWVWDSFGTLIAFVSAKADTLLWFAGRLA